MVRWLVAAGALAALVAGAVAIGNTGRPTDTPLSTLPPDDRSKPQPSVKLDPQALRVARRFVLTAVARKQLDVAYDLAGPQIRQGQTRREWRAGGIAVIPYPVDELEIAPMKVDFSTANEAQIEVALLPRAGARVKPQIFFMDLARLGGRWFVNGWVPRGGGQVRAANPGG
jgi:hypothetical protein